MIIFFLFFKIKWSFNFFRGKIVISFKLFNGVSVKVANWYKFQKKCGAENMLEFCGG